MYANRLAERLSHLLIDEESEVQGVALAEVLAEWLATHHPESRAMLLAYHTAAVWNFLSLRDAEFRERNPGDCAEWPEWPLEQATYT
jgi:hypothetical protein